MKTETNVSGDGCHFCFVQVFTQFYSGDSEKLQINDISVLLRLNKLNKNRF